MGRMFLYKAGVLCLLLAGARSQAQPRFVYKTALGPVPETKFYTIILPPALVASCKTHDLSDLRIADSSGAAVPYILQTDLPAITAGSFTSYQILGNAKRDSSTELVIGNGSPGAISSLLLVIKNASAYRTAVLSGSDDRQHWFVIDENIALEQSGSQAGDWFVQAIAFPLSNYRYFKLIINDKGLLPLNILQAGVYKNQAFAGKYLSVPVRSFQQKDSTDQYTYLRIRFGADFKTDKLSIGIRRPALYKRSVEVYVKAGEFTPVQSGELSPQNHTLLLSVKTSALLVKIFNGDNPPLVIDSVGAYQTNQQLVAQLEKGKKYYLLSGNAAVGKPDYDLQFFKDSISSKLAEISIGNPVAAPAAASLQPATGNKLLLWIVIGTVLLVLLVLTLRMSKEVGKQPS